jgi:peroxiredoxin
MDSGVNLKNNNSNRHSNFVGNFLLTLLSILLVCSVALNLLFIKQVDRYRKTIALIKQERQLLEGELVPPIYAKKLDGQNEVLDYSEGSFPTILYVFSPNCGWCDRNLDNISSLAKKINSNHRIIGLSLSNNRLKEYLASNQFTFPVYTDISADTLRSYKLGGTPQTLVISSKGNVIKCWTGAYVGSLQNEIERYFDVNLPGVSQ